MRHAPTTTPVDVSGWSRSRLLAILVAAVLVAALLVAGLGYAIYLGVRGIGADTAADTSVATGDDHRSGVAQGAARRDEIATQPMLNVPADAAFPSTPTTEPGRAISIPAGHGVVGPALIRTGFPHTPEGAIAQLAQLDLAVLQAMSPSTAAEVYNAWALPGGVSAEDWWIAASVRAFLGSTQMGEVKDPAASVLLEPAAALVKGTDGADWTTVCVLMKVTASYRTEAQIAFAHCERMQWVGGRWMIAPGTPPAPAPATWPGTALAQEAGWRPWITDNTTDDPELNHQEGEVR